MEAIKIKQIKERKVGINKDKTGTFFLVNNDLQTDMKKKLTTQNTKAKKPNATRYIEAALESLFSLLIPYTKMLNNTNPTVEMKNQILSFADMFLCL